MEPRKPAQLRDEIQELVVHSRLDSFHKGLLGALRGHLAKAVPDREKRHILLGWLFANQGELFEPLSTSMLTPGQLSALIKWISPAPVAGIWMPVSTWEDECRWAVWEANEQFEIMHGQLKLFQEKELENAKENQKE